MKILHTADIHLGKTTHGKMVGGHSSRLDDFAATFIRFAESAVDRRVNLAIVAGDLFDNRRPGPGEIHAAVRALRVLSANKIRTVVSIGNHDGFGTIADPSTSTLGWLSDVDMPFVHVYTQPTIASLDAGGEPVVVVSTPYPHKRAYDAIEPDLSVEERVEKVSLDVSDTIRQMIDTAQAAHDGHVADEDDRSIADTRLGLGRVDHLPDRVADVQADLLDALLDG